MENVDRFGDKSRCALRNETIRAPPWGKGHLQVSWQTDTNPVYNYAINHSPVITEDPNTFRGHNYGTTTL